MLKEIFNKPNNRYNTFEVLPFNTNREILHNTISCFSTYVKYEDESELIDNISNNIYSIQNTINKKNISKIHNKINKNINKKYKLYRLNRLSNNTDEYKDFKKFEKLLQESNIENIDDNLLLLVSSKYKKIETNNFIRKQIIRYINKNTNLSKINSDRNKHKNIALVTGAPASGKSSVVDMYKSLSFNNMNFNQVIKINPDYYKELLLDTKGFNESDIINFGSYTHEESAIINDMVISEWIKKENKNKHSHLMIDTSNASPWYIDIIQNTNKHGKLDILSVTVNTQNALERSYTRGKEKSRFVPTKLLLARHKEQLGIFINNTIHYNELPIRIFSNDVDFGEVIKDTLKKRANADTIEIYDMKSAVEFWNKQYINIDAVNVEEIQTKEDEYNEALIGFAKRTGKEVKLFDVEGKQVIANVTENGFEILNRFEFNKVIDKAGYQEEKKIPELGSLINKHKGTFSNKEPEAIKKPIKDEELEEINNNLGSTFERNKGIAKILNSLIRSKDKLLGKEKNNREENNQKDSNLTNDINEKNNKISDIINSLKIAKEKNNN